MSNKWKELSGIMNEAVIKHNESTFFMLSEVI